MVSLFIHAVPCKDPFSTHQASFTLTSPLACGPQEHHQYALDSTKAYIDTVCIDKTKALNLYEGSIDQGGLQPFIVLYSNPVTGSNWGTQSVTAACNGEVLFGIQTETTHFQDTVCSFTIFDQTSDTIAYVTATENEANHVTLRSAQNNTILALATRSLLKNSNPTCARTQWQVSNPGYLPAALMTYLLAFKDNANYVCPNDSAQSLGQLPTGTFVTAMVATGTLFTGSLFGAAWYYRKHYLKRDFEHLR